MNREFFSLDGTRLSGDYVAASSAVERSVLLVHGAGVDRHEDGFYDRAVDRCRETGLGVFRFDLRGHGASEGRPADLTIAGALNDIVAAWLTTREFTGAPPAFALGSSFGGGLLALAASRLNAQKVAFVNPLLKFRKRFLEDKPFWSVRGLSAEAREELAAEGQLPHVGPIMMSRPFINEVVWLDPFDHVLHLDAKAIILHGTEDTRAPFSVARVWASRIGAQLIPFVGAEHGLCVADDDDFTDPQTLVWQGEALRHAIEWFLRT